jgi:DNA-binding CsgD family transcriptional regulator
MITLTSEELSKLERALELLISPLEHASVDAWRSAVNRELKDLLNADSAGFLMPVTDALPLYSDEHDPAELARYPDYPPPPLVDGTPLWEAMTRARIGTLATIYGKNYGLYTNSTYYQEYAGANGAHDTLAASTSLGGTDARGIAIMHFWHARPDGRLFGEREVALLRLVYPAFRAGVETHFQLSSHRADLFSTIDALGQAVLVCDMHGRVVHQTPALTVMLSADAEGERLREEMLRTRTGLREVRTQRARYCIRPTLYGSEQNSASLHLIALERKSGVALSEAELQSGFGLTRAEVRVVMLIARGSSNAEIAKELSISPHTARRHTEKIFQKLGVRARAEVAPRLFS